MKAHLRIYTEPPATMGTETALCETEISNARSVMEVSGEIDDLKKLVETYRGLCRKCRKLFLARPTVEGVREWIYFLAEGQEVESQL